VTDSGPVRGLSRFLPTPALVFYSLEHKQPGVMVTGSHIPFERNGIKFNFSTGEVLKRDEAAILRAVMNTCAAWNMRDRSLNHPLLTTGCSKPGRGGCCQPSIHRRASTMFTRYLDFFPFDALAGLRILFYQHSAVGRDMLLTLLVTLGAEVIARGAE